MDSFNAVKLPFIDPSISHEGVSWLRRVNRAGMRKLDSAVVIQAGGNLKAVLLPYDQFMAMQDAIKWLESKVNDR